MKTWILFLLSCLPASAVTVGSPAAGAFGREIHPYADNLVSIPLVTRSIAVGHVIGVERESLVLSVEDSDGIRERLQAGVALRLEIITGELSGLQYPLLSFQLGRAILDTNGDDLTAHALGSLEIGQQGDLFRIREEWTVRDVFGSGADALVAPLPSIDGPIYSGGDCLLFTSQTEPQRLVNLLDAGWRTIDDVNADAADWRLPPGRAFVFRRASSVSSVLTVIGYVWYGRIILPMDRPEENHGTALQLAAVCPEPRRVRELALTSTLAETSPIIARTNVSEVGDSLLSWDEGRIGLSRAPETFYIPVGPSWYVSDTIADDAAIPAGQGFELRLWGSPGRCYWIQTLEVP